MAQQEFVPSEVIVVDAGARSDLVSVGKMFVSFQHVEAEKAGAAVQRNQGVKLASHRTILFLDDDLDFEPHCIVRIWEALQTDQTIGGVNAIIVNQRYQPPGFVSRLIFSLMQGRTEKTFAGKVIGPAVNLLPEDRDDLPDVVPVEWLNTTCTMYRREALPDPPFDAHFLGYSLMEDLAFSLRVAQSGWKLANARTARIFHDSQPGDHKSDVRTLSEMELVNRHYVMTEILGRRSVIDYARLGLWELFGLASNASTREGRRNLGLTIAGKVDGVRKIRSMRRSR